jgi:predicted SAM-dependent methyltransferase
MPGDMPPATAGSMSKSGKARLLAASRARAAVGRVSAGRQLAGATRLHLGSGDHVIEGWANIDAFGLPGVVAWDLTKTLPIKDGQVDFIFSEHFIEHVSLDQGTKLIRDCFRVLRPGGVLRVSTPDLRAVIDEYLDMRVDRWANVDWHPSTPCQMVNEALRLWGHLFVYDFAELAAAFEVAGFVSVRRQTWRESEHPELCGLELRPFNGEVIIEGTKPQSVSLAER